ncbi:MAG: 50S ribosomal protein L11 methyltransferase [Sporocytophaga sp.]|nr:50S ribosomal protein L11 methyltransferase [Sporocytophaga sp.]
MDFLQIIIPASEEIKDMLIAELDFLGFDSFQETEEGVEAYVLDDLFQEEQLKEVLGRYQNILEYTVSKLEKKNWNEEWEKNFDPVRIEDQVLIRAAFHHPDKNFPYEILINPKMAFGTGHHETTSLMIKAQLGLDHQGKTILDAGAGTGVLGIFAGLLGAKEITATDIDEWAFSNMKENAEINNINMKCLQGTMAELNLANNKYDLILANINKNVLLDEINLYALALYKSGYLLLSGFYTEDIEDIKSEALDRGLKFEKSLQKNNWACLVFQNS